jgi:hypothetical protein
VWRGPRIGVLLNDLKRRLILLWSKRITDGSKEQNNIGINMETEIRLSFIHGQVTGGKLIALRRYMMMRGQEWKKVKEIGKAFVNFYQVLFTSGGMSMIDMCLDTMETKVTAEQD